jgi:hypothetical protein
MFGRRKPIAIQALIKRKKNPVEWVLRLGTSPGSAEDRQDRLSSSAFAAAAG